MHMDAFYGEILCGSARISQQISTYEVTDYEDSNFKHPLGRVVPTHFTSTCTTNKYFQT